MPVVKNPLASAGDTRVEGSIPGLGRSPGVGNGNPLQYVTKRDGKQFYGGVYYLLGFPGGAGGKEPVCQCGDIRDTGLIPGSGRSPGGEHDNPLRYPCLENPMHRGVWQAIVHGVTKSRTRLKQLSMLLFTML